ncbi:MAG: hypothetical protein V1921_06430 [Candidatus Altiarchaeota archaeon]
MTGTKVVKLKLEDGSISGKLPPLKDKFIGSFVEKASDLFVNARLLEFHNGESRIAYQKAYKWLLDETKNVNVSPEELQEIFSRLDQRYGGSEEYSFDAGFILTALVQNSSHNDFRIRSAIGYDFLGYSLKKGKKITFEGSAGCWTGHSLDGGTLIVEDSVSSWAGSGMTGGYIEVGKNAGGWLGDSMKGGEIRVKGDSDAYTGERMEGGKIMVDGKIEGISKEYRRGEIWEGGVRRRPRLRDRFRL